MAVTLADPPVHRLDPASPDLHADAAAMRAAGPLVPVELPGGVRMWAVTGYHTGRALLTDPRFTKNPAAWTALTRGEIPADWPLLSLAAPQGRALNTVDGTDHRALRRPLAHALTQRRIEALRPRITATTHRLLNDLDRAAHSSPEHTADFRAIVAWPLPMSIIGSLLGVDPADHPELGRLYSDLFDDTRSDSRGAEAHLHAWLDALVTSRERAPGDDLTSALLALPPEQRLRRDDLVVTLYVVLAAGHETTVHLLVNALRALSRHPDQLALLRRGEATWDQAVEETMRFDSPTSNFLARFATETLDGASIHPDAVGVRITQGDPVLVSYIAMGRDPAAFGPTAAQFDITRPAKPAQLGFGHGAHFCVGAPLARLEARIALQAVFDRWPDLRVLGPTPRSPTILLNSHTHLQVRVRPT